MDRHAGDFPIAVIGPRHEHIYDMVDETVKAGASLVSVYGGDDAVCREILLRYPGAKEARSGEEILDDPTIRMVLSSDVTSLRCDLGIRVMKSGKHYFCDKAPATTLEQLDRARQAQRETGMRFFVFYCERTMSEAAYYADRLIADGVIGRVVQVMGLGPHRLRAHTRPDWFFVKKQYGGILCDIGSHQAEQFLHYTGARDARVTMARSANLCHPEYPELDDFGECSLAGDNGATGYFRVDWLTPDGVRAFGDGRTLLLGTKGFIELRKYTDLARDKGDQVYWADDKGEHHACARGMFGRPFFREMIEDCLTGTEKAMTQEHIFRAAEICLMARDRAESEK